MIDTLGDLLRNNAYKYPNEIAFSYVGGARVTFGAHHARAQRLASAIPQRKGEHAAKTLDAGLAPGLPGVHDDFRIAAGVEGMAQCLQFGNELLIVVDFPVENHADALVFVVKRLLAGGQVDDGEPAMAKTDLAIGMNAHLVGTAMRDGIGHRTEQRLRLGRGHSGPKKSNDIAHAALSERRLNECVSINASRWTVHLRTASKA